MFETRCQYSQRVANVENALLIPVYMIANALLIFMIADALLKKKKEGN